MTKVAIPIIGTFVLQNLINYIHPELLEKITARAVSIIGTFNAQNFANTAKT